jgi:hypothetical protein
MPPPHPDSLNFDTGVEELLRSKDKIVEQALLKVAMPVRGNA